MTDQDLSGKWAGEYIYGDVYTNPIKGTRVPFEIEITATQGVIKGNCVDDEFKNHFKSPATIEGSITDNSINFIKRYPCLFTVDEYGDIKLYPKLPSHEIHYSGQFQDGRFTGNWQFSIPFEDDTEDSQAHVRKGEWMMQKV
jgi:hypothetical protein